MKALSLWQPWGSLWARGRKQYETRHWATPYRGPLIVHAAKRIETDISDELREICEDEFGGHWTIELPAGALIAVCELVDCIRTDNFHIFGIIDDEEFAQGNFTAGRFAWDTQNMRELPAPIAWRGMQSLFDVPDHVVTGAPPVPAKQATLL